MNSPNIRRIPRALIAEDEPLLSAHLQSELAICWPELEILGKVADGQSALQQALQLKPDVLFLDIHMPHLSGLEVAQAMIEEWDESIQALPLIVFVTAYDDYAIKAFETAAFDYILKPLQRPRLTRTVQRLQASLATKPLPNASAPLFEQFHSLFQQLQQKPNQALRVLQVNNGSTIQMVKVDDILYFEAADKYLRVFTANQDYVIRCTLREIQAQLAAEDFWQIHRGTIVRVDTIDKAIRQDNGKLVLNLKGRTEQLQVSRLYAHLFRGL